MSIINVSICLSDLPKEKIKQAGNGKKYINIVVADRRETDAYGNTHTVYVSQSKEERDAKMEKVYVGQGKMVEFSTHSAISPGIINNLPPADYFGDLPF